MRLSLLILSLILAATRQSKPLNAATLWNADFESQNTAFPEFYPYGRVNVNRWSFLQTPAAKEGNTFVRIELRATDRYLKPDGTCVHSPCLIRSEMNHAIEPIDNFAGLNNQERYYAWSSRVRSNDFPPNPAYPHQISFFECRNVWQQIMRVNLSGTKVSLTSSFQNNFITHWESANGFTPDQWHDFILHVNWSADPNLGYIELWYDGVKVVNKTNAKTLCDGTTPQWSLTNFFGAENPNKPTFVIDLDRVIEGTTFQDVTIAPNPTPTPTPNPSVTPSPNPTVEPSPSPSATKTPDSSSESDTSSKSSNQTEQNKLSVGSNFGCDTSLNSNNLGLFILIFIGLFFRRARQVQLKR